MKKVLPKASLRSLLDGCGYYVSDIIGPKYGGYAFMATPMDATYPLEDEDIPVYPHMREVIATTYVLEFDSPAPIYVKEFEDFTNEEESRNGDDFRGFEVGISTTRSAPVQTV